MHWFDATIVEKLKGPRFEFAGRSVRLSWNQARCSSAGFAETSLASARRSEVIDDLQVDTDCWLDEQLSDPVPAIDVIHPVWVQIREHNNDLATVAGVNDPRAVRDGYAMLCGEAASRADQANVTLRQLQGDSGWDHGPSRRFKNHVNPREEVETSVAFVRVARKR